MWKPGPVKKIHISGYNQLRNRFTLFISDWIFIINNFHSHHSEKYSLEVSLLLIFLIVQTLNKRTYFQTLGLTFVFVRERECFKEGGFKYSASVKSPHILIIIYLLYISSYSASNQAGVLTKSSEEIEFPYRSLLSSCS